MANPATSQSNGQRECQDGTWAKRLGCTKIPFLAGAPPAPPPAAALVSIGATPLLLPPALLLGEKVCGPFDCGGGGPAPGGGGNGNGGRPPGKGNGGNGKPAGGGPGGGPIGGIGIEPPAEGAAPPPGAGVAGGGAGAPGGRGGKGNGGIPIPGIIGGIPGGNGKPTGLAPGGPSMGGSGTRMAMAPSGPMPVGIIGLKEPAWPAGSGMNVPNVPGTAMCDCKNCA